jgi:hypothetical protein
MLQRQENYKRAALPAIICHLSLRSSSQSGLYDTENILTPYDDGIHEAEQILS